MTQGGMAVVGMVTGGHRLDDISVVVPHKVVVVLTADQALRSKDLYRALGQHQIFRLDSITYNPGAAIDDTQEHREKAQTQIRALEAQIKTLHSEKAALEAKVQQLGQELEQAKAANGNLGQVLQQLKGLGDVMHRIEQRPVQTVVTSVAPPPTTGPAPLRFVDDAAPVFIPDNIRPKDATIQIQVDTQVSDNAGVSDAADKLRKLRKRDG